MARSRDEGEEVEEVVDDVEEEETPKRKSSRGPQPPRLSLTIPAETRRLVRIAAAKADMEPTEWCKVVLVTAAKKTVTRLYPEEAQE